MGKEIERKFLVKNETFKVDSVKEIKITQGFLSTVAERTVRIRIKGKQGFITVKGIGNDSGVSRFEWEKEIDIQDARELLRICEPGIIEKTRFHVKSGVHTFEVDEFHGENKGLVIAEIELTSEDEIFKNPNWLGKEITGNVKYYNSMIVKKPFKEWE